MYDFSSFGKEFSRIRKNLNISQAKLSELSSIAEKTISGIENDRVNIQVEYLELLSPILKMDLFKLYMDYRFDNYSVFADILKSIDKNISNKDITGLKRDSERLDKFYTHIKNAYYKNYAKQLLILIKTLILRLNKNYSEAIVTSINGIKISIKGFSLNTKRPCMLTNLEIRLMANIAISYYYQNNIDKYRELTEYIYSNTDVLDSYYVKVCYNMAVMYTRIKNYTLAKIFYQKSIVIAKERIIFDVLPTCYYGLAYINYLISDNLFINYLIKALFYSKELGQNNLRSLIFDKAKKYMDLDSEYLIILENESNNLLRKICTNCFHYNFQTANFCNNCGEKL